ncbi:MAG: Ig-like domain-containing protein [Ruminococcus sp.]|nr:Ig-like domain-containing protein [Candidatus Copronaster equi]
MKITKKILSVLLTLVLMMSVIIIPTSHASALEEDDDNQIKGTFKCDWFSESLTYPYTYSNKWFYDSSFKYNHDVATFALELSMASFKSFDKNDLDKNIEKLYKECGFEVESLGYETEAYDSIGVSFGKKEIFTGGGSYTLICLAIRSGNYGLEWGGNMRIGKGEAHEGFEIGKNKAIEYFNQYLSNKKIEGRVKILIPGYSRGASVANLMAAALDDGTYKSVIKGKDNIAELEIQKNDMFVYTFEAPQCTSAKNTNENTYKNIFNIVNPSDYVPKFIMSDWGFSLYGTTLYLPSAENVENYDEYYKELCNNFDSMMGVNLKKSSDVFYNAADSLSVNAMLDNVLSGMGKSVFKSQKYYAENYENGLIFMAANYMTQRLGLKDILKTVAVIIGSTATGCLPANASVIKKEGYRSYLAKKISESEAGNGLSKKDCEGLLEFLADTLAYVKANKYDFRGFLGQMKTIIYVHQPYVELTWMKTIEEHDIKHANIRYSSPLAVSFDNLKLPYRAKATLLTSYDKDNYTVKWESSDKDIAKVDKNGTVTAMSRGVTQITATLVDKDGKEFVTKEINVTVHLNTVQLLIYSIRSLIKK